MSLFSDIVPRDDPLTPTTPEIRVTSENLAERVSEVVVDKLKPIIQNTNNSSQLSVAVLSRIEDKLDRLFQWQEGAKPTASVPSKEIKLNVCYFCREPGHLANKCEDRAYCQGCGGNQHPYDRCEEKNSTCKTCDIVRHNALVHETIATSLRNKLYEANPKEFEHFFAVNSRTDNAQKQLQRETAKGQSSRDDTKRRGEEDKRRERRGDHSSKPREPREKYPRNYRGKGKATRRTF